MRQVWLFCSSHLTYERKPSIDCGVEVKVPVIPDTLDRWTDIRDMNYVLSVENVNELVKIVNKMGKVTYIMIIKYGCINFM